MEMIASQFNTGGAFATYYGPVLVTRDRIYCVALKDAMSPSGRTVVHHGVEGMAADMAVDAGVRKLKEDLGGKPPEWNAVSDLPADVARHPSLRGLQPYHTFLSLTPDQITEFRFSLLAGVKIVASGMTISLSILPWQVSKVRQTLDAAGWLRPRRAPQAGAGPAAQPAPAQPGDAAGPWAGQAAQPAPAPAPDAGGPWATSAAQPAPAPPREAGPAPSKGVRGTRPEIQAIIDQFEVVYAVFMAADGSLWEEYGDVAAVKNPELVRKYLPGPQVAASLNRALVKAPALPQGVSQGEEHCIFTKPSADTVAALFLHHTGDAAGLQAKARELHAALLAIPQDARSAPMAAGPWAT